MSLTISVPLRVALSRLPLFVAVFAVSACSDEAPASDETDANGSGSEGDSSSDADTADTADTLDSADETGEPLAPTWHQDVAPLVVGHCGTCHRDGGIAPFSLDSYEQAAAWSSLAIEAIERGDMPPWGQANTDECQPRHGFADDPRLSEDELALLHAWLDAGTPEGDPNSAAPLPELASLELEDADLRIEIPAPITISPGSDQFWCFVVDPGFTTTEFIDAVQIDPGNDAIVHHVLIYVDETGESVELAGDDGRYECFGGPNLSEPRLLGAWAPGALPSVTPEGVAMDIPAGAKLVMNVHYHPTGAEAVDSDTAIELRFADGAPQYLGQLALIGNFDGSLGGGMGLLPGPNDQGDTPEFRIPAGASNHTEEMKVRLPGEVPEIKLWQVSSHMHYVGTDMIIGIDRAEPEPGTGIDQECLVQTPNYDFNWQRGYPYDAPLDLVPTARAGDVIYMRCTYDNSMSNPHVVEALAEQGLDAPVDVFLGEETLDEMCLGVFGVAYSILP